MKITRNNRVIIETTNMRHGCLEQGGVSGAVDSYDLDAVLRATGLPDRTAVAAASDTDLAPAYGDNGVMIYQAIERECVGHIVRTGHIIQ